MRTLLIICLLFMTLYSCQEKKEITDSLIPVELPIKKLYIVEYNYLERQLWKDGYIIDILGYSELDQNFNLKYFYKSYKKDFFYQSEKTIADSLKAKISEYIQQNLFDTTYIYYNPKAVFPDRDPRIEYCYSLRKEFEYSSEQQLSFFLVEKSDGSICKIGFYPKTLPDDLLLLYYYLYREKRLRLINEKKNNYSNSLFYHLDKVYNPIRTNP